MIISLKYPIPKLKTETVKLQRSVSCEASLFSLHIECECLVEGFNTLLLIIGKKV